MGYQAALRDVRYAMEVLDLPYLYLSCLSVLPRVSLGKMTLEERPECFLMKDGEGVTRVLPRVDDRRTYYGAVLAVLERGGSLLMLPEYIAHHLSAHYEVALAHREYACTTERLAELSGSRLARVRTYANRWARDVEVVDLGVRPELADAFVACNDLWYRQQTQMGGKFRLYDKRVIAWLLEHWPQVLTVEPKALCLGAVQDGRVIGLNIAAPLLATWWGCYTRRHDMTANNVAMFLFREAARRFADLGFTQLSDGTADTKELRRLKDRYAAPIIRSYRARKGGKR